MVKLPEDSGFPAFVAQRIEHLTTDQKVGGSSPSKRTEMTRNSQPRHFGAIPDYVGKSFKCALIVAT